MGHIGHMGLSPMGQRGTLAVFNWELGTPVSVVNETLNRGAATPTCSVSHASRQRSVGILGGETAKQDLPSAELCDGTRDSVLAQSRSTLPVVLRRSRPTQTSEL